MKKDSNLYTIGFSILITLICGVIVSFVSISLQERRLQNEKLEERYHLLKSLKVQSLPKDASNFDQIAYLYHMHILENHLDEQGFLIRKSDMPDNEKYYTFYIYLEDNRIKGYVFPLNGQGLWGKIKGFLALEEDGQTIKGVSFFQHKETPGLGAQISSDKFANRFIGKKVWDQKKGILNTPKITNFDKTKDKDFQIDGITGATKTCNAVTDILSSSLNPYEVFMQKIIKGNL